MHAARRIATVVVWTTVLVAWAASSEAGERGRVPRSTGMVVIGYGQINQFNYPLVGQEDIWRFQVFNNRWWYWLPSNRWVVWDGANWLLYPQAYTVVEEPLLNSSFALRENTSTRIRLLRWR